MAEVTKEFAEKYLLQFLQKKDVTPEVVATFIEFIRNSGVKPVYVIPMKTRELVRFYVTLEGLLDRAYSTKEVEGLKSGIVVLLKDGDVKEREGTLYFPESGEKLVGGWAEVKRKTMSYPVKTTVSLHEYERTSNAWKSLPATMIEKVALSKALRRAFPELGGGYIPEEGYAMADSLDRIQEEESEETEFLSNNNPPEKSNGNSSGEGDGKKGSSEENDIDRKLLERKVKALGLKLMGKENFSAYLKTKYGSMTSSLSIEQLKEILKNLEDMEKEQKEQGEEDKSSLF